MAVGNRTEVKSQVDTDLVPTVTLTGKLNPFLKDDFIESAIFRKDVIASATPIGAAVTIDFAAVDTRTVTITVSTTVSFTNIENGDVKYLSITKGATDTITFAGATDVSIRQDYIDGTATLVVYQIFNKNGNIYVNSINIDNSAAATETTQGGLEIATTAEAQALALDTKIITPSKLANVNGGTLKKKVDIGDWDMNATVILAVTHSIGDWTKIIGAKATIFADDDSGLYPLSQDLFVADNPSAFGTPVITGAYATNATTIVLSRLTGGWYDSVEFNKTSYNRGYVVIEYLP